MRRWQLASFVLFFGLWELAGRWPVSPAFPPFGSTFLALIEMLRDGTLGKAYLITAQPLLLGVALCAVAGIAFGIGMGLSRTIEWFSLPVFIILQAAPMAAITVLVEELVRVNREINKDPGSMVALRKQLGLLKDLPAKLDEEIPTYFKEGAAGGIFPNDGGVASAPKNDLEFYALSGSIKKPDAKVEDFWHLAPLKAALAKLK